MNKVYLHINYFENQYSLAEAFAFTKELGCDGIEVRDRDRSGATPLESYLTETARLGELHGLDVVYGCRVDTTNPDANSRENSIADFRRVLAHAEAHGHSLTNVFTGILIQPGSKYSTSGSALATQADWETATQTLVEAADQFPTMTLAMETHSGYLHDLPRECRKFLDCVQRPNVQANLDYANIWLNRRGLPWEESLDCLKGRIGYVHLKNARMLAGKEEGDFVRVPLAEGNIDISRQIHDLAAAHYSGPICLENTMKTDKLPVARKDYAYLRQCLESLSGSRRK